MCLKQPPSPPVEPPLIRRNNRNGAAGEDFDMKPFNDRDATFVRRIDKAVAEGNPRSSQIWSSQ